MIERTKAELLEHRAAVKKLKEEIGDRQLSDEQRKRIDELKSNIEQAEADLQRAAIFDLADQQDQGQKLDDGPKADQGDKAQQDWETRCREYSIVKIVQRAMGQPVDDGPEREVQQQMRKDSNHSYDGVPVPLTALDEQRAVTTTTPSGGPGSRIVDEDYRPQDYIPLLRNSLLTPRLGLRVLRGLMGDVAIPKAKAAASVGWKAETGALDASDMEFDAHVTMSPKKVGGYSQYSQRMILQASPDIEQLVRQDLAEVLAREIDHRTLYGTGSGNQPTGLYQGVTAIEGATNGHALTLANCHALIVALSGVNIGNNARAFATNIKVALHASRQVKFSSAGSDTLYEDGRLVDVPTFLSNLIPSNISKGTGRNLSHLLYANWSDGLVGFWQELDVLVNPYESAAYKAGDVMIRIMAHMDVAKRYDDSFQYISDINTTT